MVAVVHTEPLITRHNHLSFKQVVTDTAINKMNGIDNDEDLKMADEAITPKCTQGQVVIYEAGKPILKVECGTTLEVVKLLYETESSNDSNIIGVRPKLNSGDIPCIVTLQDSKLEENAYDLITKDKRPSPHSSPLNGHMPNESNGTTTTTTRCIDCSRESWKTKRYTNVGMNTEVSINPLNEAEPVRAITGGAGGKQNQKSYPPNHVPTSEPPKRGRPPLQRAPIYSNIHPKDYVVAAMPGAIPVSVSEMEYHYRSHRSPRTSPVHLFGPTKIYPPKVDLDSVPYETLRSIHHPPPPHHVRRHSPPHRIVKVESERLSPPRRPRSRSPVYKMHKYEEDFYHHQKLEEKHRVHRVSPRYYPYEVPPPPAVIAVPVPHHAPEPHRAPEPHHAPEPHRPLPQEASRTLPEVNSTDVEPKVYVLPEDFNQDIDRFDPNILQPPPPPAEFPANKKPVTPIVVNPKPIEGASSVVSESAKSNVENKPAPEAPTTERKLSCKICKQTFPTKSTLYKHLRGHSSDEKPFKCNECGQGFTLSSNLRQHRIIHRGYKPFQCEYCGKKFMRSNVYKQHRRIHTGEQMHKCDLCPSEFLQKYALVKHLKKTHNIETYEN